MRIAHLSDLHVTDGPRLEDHRETLDRVVDQVAAASPSLVLITGDLAGRTVPHRTTPRERGVLYPALVRLARLAPVEILYGNHDQDPDLEAMAHLDGDWPIRVRAGAGHELVTVPTDEGLGAVDLYWLAYPTKRWLLRDEPATGVAASQQAVQEKLGLLIDVWANMIRRRRQVAPTVPQIFQGHLQIGGCRTSGGEVLAGQEIELSREHLQQLPVDYGALGHLHLRQEIDPRYWYAGSPWRNDYGEREQFKGWQLVHIDEPIPDARTVDNMHGYTGSADRLDTYVRGVSSGCRTFVTLDYRWGQPEGAERPQWTEHPAEDHRTESLLDRCRGAEVRMRLTVPQQWVASCPWQQQLDSVAAVAHRLQPERVVEPTLRVRAPEVAEAKTLPDKLVAYWSSIGTELTSEEQRLALELLQDLEDLDDEGLANHREQLLLQAGRDTDTDTDMDTTPHTDDQELTA